MRATERIAGISDNAASWTDADVKKLLEGMLLALERVKDPGGDSAGGDAARLQLDRQPRGGRRAVASRDAARHGQRRAVRD